MADLVVKDLDVLIGDLNELISQFEGALDFQNDEKGRWGQHNANLSMGDFADNWTIHRNKMVDAMKSYVKKLQQVDDAWHKGEQQLVESLEKNK
jgi:hypothetical protein